MLVSGMRAQMHTLLCVSACICSESIGFHNACDGWMCGGMYVKKSCDTLETGICNMMALLGCFSVPHLAGQSDSRNIRLV